MTYWNWRKAINIAPRNQVFSYKRDELVEFWWSSWRNYRTLTVNNFISVDFQTHVSVWFLISMKFCTRIIDKKRGVQKCNSAKSFSFYQLMDTSCLSVLKLNLIETKFYWILLRWSAETSYNCYSYKNKRQYITCAVTLYLLFSFTRPTWR